MGELSCSWAQHAVLIVVSILLSAGASRGQQNGNSELRTLCDISHGLDPMIMSLVETERLSYAVQGGDTRIESALELLGRRRTQYSS